MSTVINAIIYTYALKNLWCCCYFVIILPLLQQCVLNVKSRKAAQHIICKEIIKFPLRGPGLFHITSQKTARGVSVSADKCQYETRFTESVKNK